MSHMPDPSPEEIARNGLPAGTIWTRDIAYWGGVPQPKHRLESGDEYVCPLGHLHRRKDAPPPPEPERCTCGGPVHWA
jgi:hypothetical protein